MSSVLQESSATSAIPTRRFLSPSNTKLVFWLALLCQLMMVVDGTVVNIALQRIKVSLNFSDASLSWVITAYTLAFGGLLLLGARAGDLLGRRPIFLAGVATFTIASLVGGLAQNSTELLVARAAQGAGAALCSPATLALIIALFPGVRERSRAIAAFTAVSVGGSAVGMVVGGALTEYASWRWTLIINVPIGIVLLALAWPSLPRSPRRPGRFDFAGALTSTIGITSVVYGFVSAADQGWGATGTLGSFVVGALLLSAFVLVERRAEAPITPLHLFANRNRCAAYVGRLLLTAAMLGLFFFLTQFLQIVLGYTPLQTGAAFVPLTLIVFFSAQATARWLVPRFGGKPTMVVGISISTLAMLWSTQLNENSGYVMILGSLVGFGLGNGLAFISMTNFAIDEVPSEDAGAASGLVNMVQQVGGSVGLAVIVTLFATASAHATKNLDPTLSPTDAANHVFVYAADKGFWGASVLMVVALIAAIVMVKPTAKDKQVDAEEAALELDASLGI